MRNLWYKNAIIYALDVKTYLDSDGDGVGDFAGLTQRLDYLAGLGVTCIWLQPFYPSPNRDNGYDVMDYYSVDPRLGTLGDFVEFTHQAREQGMRVLIDLVVNHTSDQHPWFQSARADRNSKYRDYYVWSETLPANAHEGVIYPGVQERIWNYDEQAKAYYLHRFYYHQPDLNIANPAVQEEIRKIMGFWLELGVSGFRVDAAPFLIRPKGNQPTILNDPHRFLRQMRQFLSSRRGDAVLLAEADVEPHEVAPYFGEGDEMHLLFNFLLNQALFLAMASEQAEPLHHCLQALPPISPVGQWANFVRHHDELNLGMLSPAQRQVVFEAFAPDPDAQIYERGVRRRLPPMLAGDRRRLELAYSLLFSLPGTPVLYYGEEIGMGDDLGLPERMSVRTPMQWSPEANGGFSNADAAKLIRPVISSPEYGYAQVNVVAQHRDPLSVLNWMERLIRTRRECPEFGWGTLQILETGSASVFAHCCQYERRVAIAVHNLSAQACIVTLTTKDLDAIYVTDLLGDQQYEPLNHNLAAIALAGYGYRWFRIK
ncbi:alpha-amylase family protein [Leptolyngbya sp. FACHB-261]|uniref:alpha-amylase family protein n=1 Tax=Leptolyngbya sp. FACHB-261 TaxID=2692806 RepID=UPI001684442E|nr:alpha-amylase family protein [Leptolyngbya sp. FACHB-261]MBD2100680.1 alpha-glucosidase C-terminal domain-containing protein [Leptolyngbya sp. FACHB-261]